MPVVRLSHIELVVANMAPMERFYTEMLGFAVTDRSERTGDGEMIFLSHDPAEHHQLVLRQDSSVDRRGTLLDHLAFRVDTLAELRELERSVAATGADTIETVSHGTTWSVYVRDPEDNRIEWFVDTPWPVAQPCRFEIDLTMNDESLVTWTENHLRELALI